MFFSIIIPTYNPRQFLPRLLDSIITNKCIDDIEIIIADDRSTDSFWDILSEYSQCHFLFISNNKHYGFPRIGRENGTLAASGKWWMFIDQDDTLESGALDAVKKYIERNQIKNYLSADVTIDGGQVYKERSSVSWSLTHGKFYEKKFWKKYNIHYPQVEFCEDANLQSVVLCTLADHNLLPLNFFVEPVYNWHVRRGSVSSDFNFIYNAQYDFVSGTVVYFIDHYVQHEALSLTLNDWYISMIIDQFMVLYSQFTISALITKKPFNNKIYQWMNEALEKFLKKLEMSRQELSELITQEFKSHYDYLTNDAERLTQIYLNFDSFIQWIQNLPNINT